MGSQQILLIALVIIIIGISVVVGIKMFHQQNVSTHRQGIIQRMNILVSQALAYRRMPKNLAGGGGSFIGFRPENAVDSEHVSGSSPGAVKLSEENVNYFIEWYFLDRLKIIASSKMFGEGNYWPNSYNARIVAVFDNQGNVDHNGFQISGDW